MHQNSRNLLNLFEYDWNNISKDITYYMYFERIIVLLYHFSTVIISFPFVMISLLMHSSNYHNNNMLNWWFIKSINTFEQSGVVFIKFGQWISCRPDIFGPNICNKFIKLTNSVQTDNNKYTVENMFGIKFNELFEEFDDKIYKTSGSIARVHKGKLNKNIVNKYNIPFNNVAIKIRHHNSSNINKIALDLSIIFNISSIFEYIGNNISLSSNKS